MVLLSLSWARLGKVISLPWPYGLGNWPHGIVILIIGEVVLSHSFTLASKSQNKSPGRALYTINPPLYSYISENARDIYHIDMII